MKVRATKMGFYDGRRIYPGQVFKVKDGTKGKWFEPLVAEQSAPEVKPEPAVKSKRNSKPAPAAVDEPAPAAEENAGDLV